MKYYTTTTATYSGTRSIIIDEKCLDWTIYNAGTSLLIVNGSPVPVNTAYVVSGDDGEYFVGRVDIAFDGTGVVSPINKAVLIQRIRVEPASILKTL